MPTAKTVPDRSGQVRSGNDREQHPDWPAGAEQLFAPEAVDRAYDVMAASVRERLHDPRPVVLAVMLGGMYPAVELTRRLDLPVEVDYVHATRYRGETRGGAIHWGHWPEQSLAGRSVILVDDIFDEGHTLAAIRNRLGDSKSVITAVLALKRHDRGLPRDWIDCYGLEVPDRYVFGCGMDLGGHWRGLPGIWALPEEAENGK